MLPCQPTRHDTTRHDATRSNATPRHATSGTAGFALTVLTATATSTTRPKRRRNASFVMCAHGHVVMLWPTAPVDAHVYTHALVNWTFLRTFLCAHVYAYISIPMSIHNSIHRHVMEGGWHASRIISTRHAPTCTRVYVGRLGPGSNRRSPDMRMGDRRLAPPLAHISYGNILVVAN